MPGARRDLPCGSTSSAQGIRSLKRLATTPTGRDVENIDEILDVPGIEVIYVGPADLAFSVGKTPKLEMYEVVLAACRKRGIYPGIHCAEPAYADRMIRMGLRLTTIANDSGLMAKAARKAVAGVWREVGEFR